MASSFWNKFTRPALTIGGTYVAATILVNSYFSSFEDKFSATLDSLRVNQEKLLAEFEQINRNVEHLEESMEKTSRQIKRYGKEQFELVCSLCPEAQQQLLIDAYNKHKDERSEFASESRKEFLLEIGIPAYSTIHETVHMGYTIDRMNTIDIWTNSRHLGQISTDQLYSYVDNIIVYDSTIFNCATLETDKNIVKISF